MKKLLMLPVLVITMIMFSSCEEKFIVNYIYEYHAEGGLQYAPTNEFKKLEEYFTSKGLTHGHTFNVEGNNYDDMNSVQIEKFNNLAKNITKEDMDKLGLVSEGTKITMQLKAHKLDEGSEQEVISSSITYIVE